MHPGKILGRALDHLTATTGSQPHQQPPLHPTLLKASENLAAEMIKPPAKGSENSKGKDLENHA